MRNVITQFSRIFVGVLFIISGLLKLDDPVGFSYKLAEYFTVFHVEFLTPLALAFSLFLVILEVVLGLMLLVGFKPKLTVWSLLLLIVFFTFLTFYSAYFNKVTDCGCFGDALKLTPWQSFTKDVVLLVFILVLFANQKLIRPFLSKGLTNAVVLLGVLASVFMGYWVLNHLPVIDFRPYKIGTDIEKGMEIPEGAPRAVVEMVFVYNVNGQNKEFTEKDLMSIPEGATFVERKDNVISEGYKPAIHDFSMEKDGADHTAEMLGKPKLLAIVAYDLSKSDPDGMQKLEGVARTAKSQGYEVVAMTASGEAEIAAAKKKYGLSFDFYFCDATTLKTIERANPSLIVLHYGTIVDKKHHNDADDLKL
jgi:uncharacterized membrane protein YphA (DoxX/SURF4 family)